MKRLLFLIVLSLAAVLPRAQVAFAESSACTSTVNGAVFPNGLSVPAGQICTINAGSVVQGDVIVGAGGAFVAIASTVSGNVVGDAATVQILRGSSVGGSVVATHAQQLPNSTATRVSVCGSRIGGSLYVIDTPPGGPIRIGTCVNAANNVGGNSIGSFLVFRNNLTSSNEISGTRAVVFACDGNSPVPMGSGNAAQFKTGQCLDL